MKAEEYEKLRQGLRAHLKDTLWFYEKQRARDEEEAETFDFLRGYGEACSDAIQYLERKKNDIHKETEQ